MLEYLKSKKIIWYLLIISCTLIWSLHALAIRYLIVDYSIDANFITFIRFLWWGLFLLILSISLTKTENITKLFLPKHHILKNKNFILAVLFLFLNFFVFHISLKYTFASDWLLMETLAPMIVFLLLLFLFPKKVYKISNLRKIFIAVLIWSVWAALIAANYSNILWISFQEKIFGNLVQFIWMIFFGCFMIYSWELKKNYHWMSNLAITAIVLLWWAFLSIPLFMWWLDSIYMINDLNSLMIVLFLTIWATWIAYYLWYLSMHYLNIITLAIFINLTWIISIFFEWMIYKDISFMSWKLILWWILIFASSTYVEYLNNKK